MRKIWIAMLLLFMSGQIVSVLATEIVLQNGLDGYTGCVDTWIVRPIGTSPLNKYTKDTNCGDSMSLKCELVQEGMA